MIRDKDIPRAYRYFAILALALVTYGPTLQLGFLWDDHVMIEANPALREWSERAIRHDFTTDVFDGHGDPYYRPAQTLLNRIDYTIWGLQPFGYHLTNLTSHALNALLVSELVILLGLGTLAGLVTGCLFAVTPVPVEQLIIIAGRAELFGLTFLLTSLLLLLQKDKRAWMGGYLAYTIALFFKESTLIGPALLALLIAYRKEPASGYQRLVPMFLIDIPYLWLRHHAVGPLVPMVEPAYVAKFFYLAFPRIALDYVRLILFPWNLHSHRIVPHLSPFWPLLLVAFLGLFAYLIRERQRLLLLGLGWFVLALLPKTPVMIYGNFRLDHFAYPASVGILLLLGVGYAKLWQKRHKDYRMVLAASFFPLMIYWALMVPLNVQLRGTDEKMYRWALHFSTSAPIQYNLGMLLLQKGEALKAIPYLFNYLAVYPENPHARAALAESYQRIGQGKAAASLFKS